MASATFLVLLCAAAVSLALAATGAAAGGYPYPHWPNPNPNPNAGDLVAQTCAAVTTHRRHYRAPGLTRQFCESMLRSDQHSAAARDARGLALVAMDLVQGGAAFAGGKVDAAIRAGGAAGWGKPAMHSLTYCRQDHFVVAHNAPKCRALVHDYNHRHGSGNQVPFVYLECADRLVHATQDCLAHMLHQGGEAKNEVWNALVDVAERANLAKAMVEQMVGVFEGDAAHDD